MSAVTLLAVGDVLIERPEPSEAFAHVAGVFADADVVFGNCEAVYTDATDVSRTAGGVHKANPANCGGLGAAGFDVMSFANNHAMDVGVQGMRDTLALLHAQEIATLGAGESLEEALLPAIVNVRGVDIGFLMFACVYPPGSDAREDRPGCATLRVHTLFEQREVGQPGTPPRIITFVDAADLALVKQSVSDLRSRVDIVVFTPHWGVHLLPAVVADYERELARVAIDAGADIVLGHHQHILKGVDVYQGKVIFHGLGNFVFDIPELEHLAAPRVLEAMRDYGEYAVRPIEGYPTYPFHPESRMTIIVGIALESEGLRETAFLPCVIDSAGCPVPQRRGTTERDDVLAYMSSLCERANLVAEFSESDAFGPDWVRVG